MPTNNIMKHFIGVLRILRLEKAHHPWWQAGSRKELIKKGFLPRSMRFSLSKCVLQISTKNSYFIGRRRHGGVPKNHFSCDITLMVRRQGASTWVINFSFGNLSYVSNMRRRHVGRDCMLEFASDLEMSNGSISNWYLLSEGPPGGDFLEPLCQTQTL